jgi:hypothetical protein
MLYPHLLWSSSHEPTSFLQHLQHLQPSRLQKGTQNLQRARRCVWRRYPQRFLGAEAGITVVMGDAMARFDKWGFNQDDIWACLKNVGLNVKNGWFNSWNRGSEVIWMGDYWWLNHQSRAIKPTIIEYNEHVISVIWTGYQYHSCVCENSDIYFFANQHCHFSRENVAWSLIITYML